MRGMKNAPAMTAMTVELMSAIFMSINTARKGRKHY